MRLLANENLPGDAVDALRARGHDVLWVRTAIPGASDVEVLSRAGRERRLLLTLDKHFGELAFRARLPADFGVVLFRLPLPSPGEAARLIVAALEARSDWKGVFSVVEVGRIRMVPLPR